MKKIITILFCIILTNSVWARVVITYDNLCRPTVVPVFEDSGQLGVRLEETRNWLSNNLSLKIERDPIWSQIILPALYTTTTNSEPFFRIPNHDGLYIRPQNYRVDLIFFDLIEQVNRILEDRSLQQYKSELQQILGNNPVANFMQWYTHLKDLAENNNELKRKLNSDLIVQIYNASGAAHPFEISLFTPQRSLKIKRNRDVVRYNEYGQDPEAFFLLSRMSQNENGISRPLTVIQIDESSRRDRRQLDQIRNTYYEEYCQQVRSAEYCGALAPATVQPMLADGIINEQETQRCLEVYQEMISDRSRRNHRSAETPYFEIRCRDGQVRVRTPEGASHDAKTISALLFNTIEELPYKLDIYQEIDQELFETHGIHLPQVDGRMILTPSLIHEHRDQIRDLVHDFTYRMLLSDDDDEITLHLRHWIKGNYEQIMELQRRYNQANPNAKLEIKFNHPNFRIRRFEAMDQFDDLRRLYEFAKNTNQRVGAKLIDDATPWNQGMNFDLIGPNGRPLILGHNRIERIADSLKRTMHEMLKPENVLAKVTGAGVTVLTGNLALGRASAILVQDSLHAYIYDVPASEAFKDTPLDLATSLVSSAGFVPGRIPYMAFTGSVHGGLRALATGQNVGVGMMVGGASEVLRNTVLPYDLAHPTIALSQGDVIDRDYIIRSTLLGVGYISLYQGTQGAVTSLLSDDETVAEGFLKGAAYGVADEALMTTLFGYQYDMFGLFGDDVIKNAMDAEADYTLWVKTHGINLEGQTAETLSEKMYQEAGDIEYRVGGIWPNKVAGASFSGFGFVSSPDDHIPGYFSDNPNNSSGSLIGHEVGQHQTQWRDMSSMGFLTTYSVFAVKYGTEGGYLPRAEGLAEEPTRDWNPMEQYRTHD